MLNRFLSGPKLCPAEFYTRAPHSLCHNTCKPPLQAFSATRLLNVQTEVRHGSSSASDRRYSQEITGINGRNGPDAATRLCSGFVTADARSDTQQLEAASAPRYHESGQFKFDRDTVTSYGEKGAAISTEQHDAWANTNGIGETNPKTQVSRQCSMKSWGKSIASRRVTRRTRQYKILKKSGIGQSHPLQFRWHALKRIRTKQLRRAFTKLHVLRVAATGHSEVLPSHYSSVKFLNLRLRRAPTGWSSTSFRPDRLPLERYLTYWSVAFSKLHSSYLPKPFAVKRQGTWRFEFDRIARKVLRRYGQSRAPRNAIPKVWHSLSPRLKRRYWMSALLFALHENPPKAALILHDLWTSRSPYVPAYVAEDCVNHICSFFLKYPSSHRFAMQRKHPSRDHVETCLKLISSYLEYYKRCLGSASLSHHTIYDFLIPHLTEEQLHRLLTAFKQSGAQLTTREILQFVRRCMVYHRVDIILELLKMVRKEDFANQTFQETCAKILRQELRVENLYNVRSNILSFMLELGILPNRMLYDTILLNAMEAGDRSTAWRFHEICQNNGVNASAFTYSILLKGVEHGDDFAAISSIYRASQEHRLAHRSPPLGFSLVFATYQLLERKHQKKRFDAMLSVYSELFDLNPLRDLGLVSDVQQPQGVMKPNRSVLGCMISAWINENSLSLRLFQVYERYLSLVDDEKSRISTHCRTPHVINSFLMAFGKQQANLGLCTSIVQNMLRPKNSDSKEPSTELPMPDIYTWNILLQNYARHNQLEAAEKILLLMKSKGALPNEVTWNQLMHAYTRIQDVPMVLDTLKRRQQAGFDTDDRTLNMLLKINDRTRLLELIDKASKGFSKDGGDGNAMGKDSDDVSLQGDLE